MNKTLALAILLGVAVACDPWLEDCTPASDKPQRYKAAYWMHGITSWIQSIYMAVVLGAFYNSLALLGTLYTNISWALAGLSFAGYFPVALIWTLTVVWDDVGMYKRYNRWLQASNIYGWILTVSNIGWYLVLVLMIAIFHTFDAGVTKPDIYLPVAGLSIEAILQIMYSIGYVKSRKLMLCWGYDFYDPRFADLPPEERCPWEEYDVDNEFDDSDEPLFEVTINI